MEPLQLCPRWRWREHDKTTTTTMTHLTEGSYLSCSDNSQPAQSITEIQTSLDLALLPGPPASEIPPYRPCKLGATLLLFSARPEPIAKAVAIL